jgi:hypothetical protein
MVAQLQAEAQAAQVESRREMEREKQAIQAEREARLCEICLDRPKDTALACGHQACGSCARELTSRQIFGSLSPSERSCTFKIRFYRCATSFQQNANFLS